jgi:hypothetical protein
MIVMAVQAACNQPVSCHWQSWLNIRTTLLLQKHKTQKVLQSGLRTKKKQRQIAHKQRMLEREEAVKAAVADAPEEVEMKQAKPRSKKAKQADAMEM